MRKIYELVVDFKQEIRTISAELGPRVGTLDEDVDKINRRIAELNRPSILDNRRVAQY